MKRTTLKPFSIGQKSYDYVADFETTTDPDDCRVWAWGYSHIGENVDSSDVVMGNNISSFIQACSMSLGVVYFHNLAFDGSFIIDWLLNNGYTWSDKQYRNKRRSFTTLISGLGKFYSISVTWNTGKTTEFRDSLKKLPMSVERIAKSFELETSKLEMDYDSFRPVGHELTSHEREYLAADIIIVAQALAQQFSHGMIKLTVGSDALSEYVRTIGGKKMFTKLFPVLPQTMDDDIRAAYRGGWTYRDPRGAGKVHYRKGRSYDVNSLYPFVMRTKLLPYGEPIFTDDVPVETEEFPLFVTSITFTAKLKRGHLPCIQVKKNMLFSSTEYQTSIDEPTTISCTNIDLDLWKKHYHLNILSYNGSWLFRGSYGLFNEYIDKWMEVKKHSVGGKREIAKLELNSLYGKFATNPIVTSKRPILVDGVVKLQQCDDETKDPIYTPVGVFVTAHARTVTITAAQNNYSRFAYADTDSIHLWGEGEPKGIAVDSTELGAWKHESDFDAAIFIRAKAYAERINGKVHTHIAGVPLDIASKMGFNDLRDGARFDGKLVPRRVPGGIVLTETHFTLNI